MFTEKQPLKLAIALADGDVPGTTTILARADVYDEHVETQLALIRDLLMAYYHSLDTRIETVVDNTPNGLPPKKPVGKVGNC